jgi:hypothetical protein
VQESRRISECLFGDVVKFFGLNAIGIFVALDELAVVVKYPDGFQATIHFMVYLINSQYIFNAYSIHVQYQSVIDGKLDQKIGSHGRAYSYYGNELFISSGFYLYIFSLSISTFTGVL